MKRTWLGVTVSASVMLAAAVGVAGDWPCYLGPDQTSASAETGLLRSWPAEGPKVLWTTPVGAGFAAPVVSGGEVFILDRGGPEGKVQDIFRCLGLADGKEKWHVAYDAPGKVSFNGSRTAGAADEKYVFTVGLMGHLSCFDRQEKKLVWQKNILKEYGGAMPNWGVSQSPVLYGASVIVGALGSKAGLVAFNKADGKEAWAGEPMGKMEYVSPILTTIAGVDQVLVVGGGGKTVAGVSPTDGKTLWTYTGWGCKIPIAPPACLGEGRVLLTGGYGAGSAMLQVSKGQAGGFTVTESFRTKACGAQIHRPLFYKDHLYVNGNDNRQSDGLLCMDLTGKVLWKTGRDPFFERGGMLLADGLIFMVDSSQRSLYLIEPDPAGFKVLSSVKILDTEEAWSPLALSEGKLLIRDKASLKCLDVKGK
ncbi:MAG: PQQ-binding-like beta-propeller repeat protein [Planctomycetota bacterium]|nr:PQQ-binding-like beta-propeller repeat protein [Planctomycetota bacterium]